MNVVRFLRQDRGQAMAIVAMAATVVVGAAALAIDTGHARYTFRELQQVTDSSALAAARAIPTATSAAQIIGQSPTQRVFSSVSSNGIAAQFSAVPGGMNQRTTLPNITVTSTLLCLDTLNAQGIPCIGLVPYNAVQVTQVSILPTYFGGVLRHPTVTLTTTATAAVHGGSPRPSNIAVIMDTTLSMNESDANCGYTQMQCALNGLQVLLKNLSPCGANQTSCHATGGVAVNSFDRVSLFTFPNVSTSTAAQDLSCTTPLPSSYYFSSLFGYYSMPPQTPYADIPTDTAYTFPSSGAASYSPSGSTYQLTGFLSDYRISDTATTLNQTSTLVNAAGGTTGCGSMVPGNYDGNYGTFYAGAIYAAQAALLNVQASNPGSDNVLILLSDGDATAPQILNGISAMPSPANASGIYPSYVGECGQGITAAAAATAAGTRVYTVAYGSSAITGCASDALGGSNLGVTPCDAMALMASAAQMFYSDWRQTGSDGTCIASQPVTSLNGIFAAIANDLTQARLIPNNTT